MQHLVIWHSFLVIDLFLGFHKWKERNIFNENRIIVLIVPLVMLLIIEIFEDDSIDWEKDDDHNNVEQVEKRFYFVQLLTGQSLRRPNQYWSNSIKCLESGIVGD